MLTTNPAYWKWTEIFGSDRLTGACWTGSLIGATSWKPMGEATALDRTGKDHPGNAHHGRTQTRDKLRKDERLDSSL